MTAATAAEQTAPEQGCAGQAGARQAVADAHRREWAFVLAATVRVAQDLDLAEESKLPLLVEPDEPAPHRLTDHDEADAAKLEDAVPDERLRLIFTCCHPTLAQQARLALTLRLVCGLPTPDIARALLVSEQTMAARITRAKKKISVARIPYRVPRPAELPDRLAAVLGVLHLLFTAGHTAPSGPALMRTDLADRALDLARALRELMPDEPEVRGLLALILATDARRATRTGADGRLLRLEEQDRSRWNRGALAEAHELIVAGLRGGRAGGRAEPDRAGVDAPRTGGRTDAGGGAGAGWPALPVPVPAGDQGRPASAPRSYGRGGGRVPAGAGADRQRG
ncbi:DUF6596 domain-containing protein [Nonomuraea sp. NPDC049158]|uniref:RNA polymerase sigma factor n=1 Tax=Nonomuraea sp. NPDC049158 TaxID=3155649 RepID=UPI0033C0E971